MLPSVPREVPITHRPIGQKLGLWTLKLLGWKITGDIPNEPKMICAVAPHTSNWDFVVGIAAMLALNLKISFLGKDAIFIWPFGALLKKLGGIPVNRRKSHGVVGQLVSVFERQPQLLLALAPEGTRSKTKQWKTGFLAIAHKANVPVIPLSLHFDCKEIRFGEPRKIGSDIEAELASFKLAFNDACAKNPQSV